MNTGSSIQQGCCVWDEVVGVIKIRLTYFIIGFTIPFQEDIGVCGGVWGVCGGVHFFVRIVSSPLKDGENVHTRAQIRMFPPPFFENERNVLLF